MPSALQFDGVTKVYRYFRGRSIRALDDFTLAVQPGEIVGFLGPNGAGKTTAIHLAMGFMRSSGGGGHMLGAPFGHARTRRRVGFLAENVALYHRTAVKLVRYYGALNGMRDPLLAQRTREVLEQVGIAAEANRNAGKFSRGMLQRVGLAQALVNDPELLMLDEPTSALDPLGRIAVRELLLACRRAGKTIFLSSHMLAEVEVICDRVAIVTAGHVVRIGRTAELLESHAESEVIARGLSPAQFAAEAVDEGLRVIVPSCALREMVERIWSAGGEVIRVNPLRRSLEDLFVELVRDGNAQPSALPQDEAARRAGS